MMQTTSTTLPQDGVAALQHKPWPRATQFQHNKYKPYIFASMSIGSNARMLLDFHWFRNLRVSETQAAYCPTDTAGLEMALDSWECTTPVKHIQNLLLLSKSVEVLTDYQIGRQLAYLANDSQ